MSDSIQGPPKTVQQAHNLRSARAMKLNEERSDEDRHLAEMEERMRNARRRKETEDRESYEGPLKGKDAGEKAAVAKKRQTSEKPKRTEDGHIDFTA